MTKNEGFLGPQGLAELLDIPVRTVYAWRTRREGPRAHKIGRHVRYRLSDVEEWLSDRADQPRAT